MRVRRKSGWGWFPPPCLQKQHFHHQRHRPGAGLGYKVVAYLQARFILPRVGTDPRTRSTKATRRPTSTPGSRIARLASPQLIPREREDVVAKNRRVRGRGPDGPGRLVGFSSGRRQGQAVKRGRLGGRRRKHRHGPDQLSIHEADRETAPEPAGHRRSSAQAELLETVRLQRCLLLRKIDAEGS